ncbi:DUF2380 domain-containing protein [Aurantimonas sp. 22II-16-19i]|uniref:DUF2380 domain-containing protein n=1 Tax=Aurantimonas sp. 22II-16-19i TaxID=1317114 RepID=UPI0009F7BB4B|nr:DUF2380 domain-containing protein [Aurantimonas sp. 22II-16-19i]ORE93837.1 hypothetical protein ATO4_15641 [Aurantimonas sp. 22II-16-19i]
MARRFGTDRLLAGIMAVLLAASSAGAADEGGARGAGREAPRIAVAKFDYKDTSGEVRDQTAEHAARLDLFRTRLEAGLTGDVGAYAAVPLGCMARDACSLETLRPEPMLRAARAAGADYLVFGGVHKMSTLVGFGRIDVLDVAANRLVFDRVISFRGDTDEAFARAADFVARDILRTLSAGPARAAGGERAGSERGIR